jgi:peptide deformylase
MILPIVPYGNPVLRQKGARLAEITPDIRTLVEDMLETMRDAQGVGLAAQQIGRALQLAVVDVTGIKDRPSKMWIQGREVDPADYMPMILINPELFLIKTKEAGIEGCLSFPGLSAEISRPRRVAVKATTLDGLPLEFEAAGLLGRAIQHEFDHLQGILFIDRMDPADRAALKEEIEALRQPPSA